MNFFPDCYIDIDQWTQNISCQWHPLLFIRVADLKTHGLEKKLPINISLKLFGSSDLQLCDEDKPPLTPVNKLNFYTVGLDTKTLQSLNSKLTVSVNDIKAYGWVAFFASELTLNMAVHWAWPNKVIVTRLYTMVTFIKKYQKCCIQRVMVKPCLARKP